MKVGIARHIYISVACCLIAAVPASEACTTAIVSAGASSTGKPLLWKQRDAMNPFNTVVTIAGTDSTFAYTGLFNVGDLGLRSAYAGQNEKGFAIVNNVSYNLAVKQYPPENGSLMRRALEHCATVDEFETLVMAENPRLCEANFAVVDATGAAAYFEAADSSVTRFDVPEGGWLVRANYSVTGKDGKVLPGSKMFRSGMARYETAYALMASHKGKFSPEFFIDCLGRSWYNAVLGYDASKRHRNGRVYDEDFIPRTTTVSSVCFDGHGTMWTAVGYTPASYAMPLEACGSMPSCLAEANALADSLKYAMHPLPRDGAVKYIDFKTVRRVVKIVRRYEKEAALLKGDNDALDRLFTRFKQEF